MINEILRLKLTSPGGVMERSAGLAIVRSAAFLLNHPQVVEKPLPDGVAAILYRQNGNRIKPALGT
jgi:hypothetical protein